MNEKLYGGSKYSLSQYTTQELLGNTLITKDLNKSNSILKKLPDEIIRKILVEHVGAQELGLIANRGKINLYYDKKVKDIFKTIGEKKLKTIGEKNFIIKQYKELIEQKRLYKEAEQQHSNEVAQLRQEYEEEVQKKLIEYRRLYKEAEQQHSSEVAQLRQEHEEEVRKITANKVSIISQIEKGYDSKLQEEMLTFRESTQQKFNADIVDEFSTFMLLNEHFGDTFFQNKNTTYTVELGVAGVLSAMAYKNGISYEYTYLPLVRALAFIAKDAAYSQKESVKQKLSQYLSTESYYDEVDLSLNFVFDTAIAYVSPNFSMSLLVSGANSVSNYLEISFGSDYIMTSTNGLSNAIGGGIASLFALSNKHVLMGANKYPIYNVVSTLLGTKYIYEISNILSAKALDLVGITPENVVEGAEAVKEHAIDIMNTGECVMWKESSLSVDGNQLNDASQPMHCKLDANLDHYHNVDSMMMYSNFM